LASTWSNGVWTQQGTQAPVFGAYAIVVAKPILADAMTNAKRLVLGLIGQ